MGSPTNVAKLVSQIGIIQAAAKISFDTDPASNVSVQNQVAAYLDAAGTTDVRNLRSYSDSASRFWYDIVTGFAYVNMATDSTSAIRTTTQYSDAGDFTTSGDVGANPGFATAKTDSFYYEINLTFSSDGYPVFWATKDKIVPTWRSLLGGSIFIASFVVTAAFPGLAMTIGQAVMGAELAASYPALAVALGNACVGTALSGGNVKAGVEGAVFGGVGGAVGGVVASATDSAIIGQVASAATKAVLSGGDIQGAVLQSLAVAGVNSIGSLPSFSGASNMQLGDDTSDDSDVSSADLSSLYSDAGYGDTSYLPDTIDASNANLLDSASLYGDTAPGDALTAPNPALSPATSPGGVVASSGGLNLTQLAAAALPLITAYVRAGSPGVMTSNANVTANANGTLRNANGTVTTMPVGTPYLTSAGVVTNNGNGTYSVVASNGTITTQAYPPGTAGAGIANMLSNIGTPGILAIAAVAFLILK